VKEYRGTAQLELNSIPQESEEIIRYDEKNPIGFNSQFAGSDRAA
jgi:hypothetical protein